MVTSPELRSELLHAPDLDAAAKSSIEARIADILRPAGALARLDEMAIWLAGWQRTTSPSVTNPAAVIFAADHGVIDEGVSAYPADVTRAMMAAFEASQASVSALASVAGASVATVDVGVGRPTKNLRVEAAMSHERFNEAFNIGRSTVRSLDTDLLIIGEMGIGNTTAAAAVCASVLGQDTPSFVGRWTGLDDGALATKKTVVRDAVERIQDERDPLEILRQVGGAELAAMTGAFVEARMRSIPVLLDGYIATTPAVVLHALDSSWVANCRAGHCSAEPGHHRVLDHLGLTPLLTLDMRLGEASGAMAAVPLIVMACKVVTDVPTFTEWFSADA